MSTDRLPAPVAHTSPVRGPDIQRPEQVLIDGLRNLSSATVGGSLDHLGLRRSFIRGPIARTSGAHVVGPIVTLQFMPLREDLVQPGPPGETEEQRSQRSALWGVMDQVQPGDVLVIAANGNLETGCIGEMLSTYLWHRGVAGLVVDGCVRDWPRVKELSLPVWASGMTPNNAGQNTITPWAYNVPVACGGALVLPGDIAVADDDGAVVLPAGLANSVLEMALAKADEEEFSREQLRAGGALGRYYPMNAVGREEYEAWRKRRAQERR